MSKPLRGRAAAEAAAKAQDLAKVALAQRDAREGAGDLPPSLAAPVMATPLAPPAQPLSPLAPLAPLAAPAAAQAPVVELPLQTPGSAVQLQEAAQLRGGPVPMVPWYSGIGGDAPVLAKAEVEKVRKLRDEFEGASAEYRVLSQVAVAGMTSKEGKSLQKRFKELEQAWGAFQWNQKSRSLNPTTREEVQAASAALAAQPKGVDLEHEVETVLAELWDSLEKPVKPRRAEFSDPQLDEELDRLEAYIEARIHEEEKAEREGREAKSRPKLAVCATQSEVLGDMSAKFQQSHPMGLDEGTGGTPMTSYTAQEEVHVLPGSGAWFDHEVQHLSKEVHSVSDKLNKDSSMLEASVSVDNAGQGENAELVAAIQAERRTLARQCQCIAAWTFARLEQMREQYNEIFARMDDWIKDRVREENEAIKETERQLRTGKWEDEEGHQTISRTMTVRRSHTGNVKPAPSSAAGKRRRDVLKVIVPKTLDVNVYVPPKLEVLPSTDTGSMVRSPSTVSQGLGKTRSSFRVPAPEKWSQEMMWGLLTRLTSNLEMGACDAEQLMKALLERRHGALGFENEQVIPPSWVQRPLAVYHLLCRSFVEPAWGATQVDLTEFFLALTHHENFLTWPTMEALEATRSFLHSEESSLSEEELAMYPDVDVSEELFCQLPLWPGGCPSEMRRWMFQVLCCFSQAEICLPPKPGGQDTTPRSVTARRIIGYFGLANAPAKAFSQFCRLLLPAKLFSAAEEDPSPQVLVKDLWTILYSQRTRPAAMMAPVPDLATFCNNLIDEGKVPDAVPKAKAKAKGKAKPEVEEETEAPVIPEEATVAFSEQVLMSRQTVLKALLSHGGLLCRRRGLDMLFPNAGSIFPLKTSAEAEALKELQSLVPEPPPEEEAPAEVAEGS